MRKYILIIFLIIIFIIDKSTIAYAEEDVNNRIILILYDNSSSMVFDDAAKFHTNWVEADYAIRALAASCEKGDKILIYPMNSSMNGQAIEIEGNNSDTLKINGLSGEFYPDTPFTSIDMALDILKEQGDSSSEKWLLILTDGAFRDTEAEKGKGWIEDSVLLEKLNQIEHDIHVLYLPMGEESKKIRTEKLNDNIRQIDGNNNILQQILDGFNTIYNRNVLYASYNEDGTLQYKVDLPVKELIVFWQTEGEVYKFVDRNQFNDGAAKGSRSEAQIQGFLNQISEGEISSEPIRFQSYQSSVSPIYRGTELRGRGTAFEEELLIKDICGEVWRWQKGNKSVAAESPVIYEFDLQDNESMAVYYNLDLGIQVEIDQDDERMMLDDKIKLKEGEFGINVYPINLVNGKQLSEDAELLRDVNLKINGDECHFGRAKEEYAVYGEEHEITVEVSGGGISEPIIKNKQIDVEKRLYPLEIELVEIPEYFSYERMERAYDDFNGDMDRFSIEIYAVTPSGKVRLQDEMLDQIEVECVVDYKGLKRNERSDILIEQKRESKGFDFYPYLQNVDSDKTYEDVICMIKGYYKGQLDNEKDKLDGMKEINLLLKGEPFKFNVSIDDSKEYTWWNLMVGGIDLEASCNGEILAPDTKLEMKSFEDSVWNSGWQQNKLRRWSSGAVSLFFYDEKEIPVHMNVSYTRRGETEIFSINDSIIYKPVPVWARYLVRLLIVLFCIWIVCSILFWGYDIGFGAKFHPYLKFVDFDENTDVKIRCRFWNQIFFRKRIRIDVGQNYLAREEFPVLDLHKKTRENFSISNYSEFKELNVTIDGRKINANTEIDYNQIIRITCLDGSHYELHFIKDEMY